MDRERIAEHIVKAVREVWGEGVVLVPMTQPQSDFDMTVLHKIGTGQDTFKYIKE